MLIYSILGWRYRYWNIASHTLTLPKNEKSSWQNRKVNSQGMVSYYYDLNHCRHNFNI